MCRDASKFNFTTELVHNSIENIKTDSMRHKKLKTMPPPFFSTRQLREVADWREGLLAKTQCKKQINNKQNLHPGENRQLSNERPNENIGCRNILTTI